MALAAYVDSLEALPEALRPFYVPTEDGRFRLDAEGVEDVSGLKSALEKERAARKALKAELEAAREAQDAAADENAGPAATVDDAAGDGGAAEDGGAADRAREPGDTTDGTTAAEPERDPAVTRLRALLERRLVEAEATTAVLAARGVPQLLLPAILPMLGVVEEDGQPRVRVVDEDGRPREDAEGRPLAVAALVDELARSEIYGRAFDGRGKTGSGTPATGQGADVATISLSDPAALGRHLADIAAGRVRVAN